MDPGTVLITGASRGLGAATARIVVRLGGCVTINARSADRLAEVAAEIRSDGGDVLHVAGDISLEETRRQLVDRSVERFGRLDALVNNAGILLPIARLAEADPQAWEKNLATNLLGPVMLTQAVLPHLRERAGRVINVSSGAAINPVEGWGAYCAAKAALNHFTRVLAAEEPRVTAIAFRPGVVDTEMQATIRREGQQGMLESKHARFVRDHAEGQLLPPDLPGLALAVLALFAPPEWSGEFISWEDPRVRALVDRV